MGTLQLAVLLAIGREDAYKKDMNWDRSSMHTPEYKAALIKELNRRGEPRTFYGFREGDLLQMELLPIMLGGRAVSAAGYIEGYVTDAARSYFAATEVPVELKDLRGHELGVGVDTVTQPMRAPQVPVTLHRAMVAGREAVLYKTADVSTFSRYQDPEPEYDRRPMARYGRVMIAGVTLFDVRPESTLQ